MNLSIIVINYNSASKLRQCVDALVAETVDIDSDIIVVDNASKDGSAEFISEQQYSRITGVYNEFPFGYCFAANQGFALSKSRYVLFSNPDMIPQKGTIGRMIKHLEDDPSLGLTSGYYLTPEHDFEKYYNRFPSVLAMFLSIYLPRKIALKFKSYRSYHMIDIPFAEVTEVQQPAGAFVMLDREIFGDDLIEPKFGLMFGDLEIAWKVHLKGRGCKVFNDTQVIHNHADRVINRASDISEEYLYTTDYFVGMFNFFKKYHGTSKAIQVKLIFGFMLACTAFGCFLKELLTFGEPFRVLWYRSRILWNFLLNKNPKFELSRELSEKKLYFSRSRITGPKADE